MKVKTVKFKCYDKEVELRVGDKILLRNCNDHGRNKNSVPSEITVSRIGRRWISFTGYGYREIQFNAEGAENSQYSHNTLYSSLQGIRDMKERHGLIEEVKRKITYSSQELSLEQVKSIAKILGIDFKE